MNEIVQIPAREIPTWRASIALQNKVQNNLLMTTWGGLGDQVCAEPTFRWALKNLKNKNIHLLARTPKLFDHLDFKSIVPYEAIDNDPTLESKFFLCNTFTNSDRLAAEFLGAGLCNAVDFASILALRLQLPVEDKNIVLTPSILHFFKFQFLWSQSVVIHPGRHWASRTFPTKWWNDVIRALKGKGFGVVLIGKDVDQNVGTVDVDATGCIDLRNKTTLNEMIFILQKSFCVITNDSSPVHIAASGSAHIGMIASSKHPDLITHWRKNDQGVNQFGWRTKNLGLDGLWNHLDICMAQDQTVSVGDISEDLMKKILPEPDAVADFAEESQNQF